MRRFVRDCIAAALERARPAFEDYISHHLQYPLGFPYKLIPAVVIREFRSFKATPLARADLPPVQVEVLLKAWLANRSVRLLRGGWDPGVIHADVQLTACGTVNPDGPYSVEPRSAALKAWSRDMRMVESKQVGRLGGER